MNPNYSYSTSLQPFLENKPSKKKQADMVYDAIIELKENACIKLIAEIVGIPDAIASARINGLLEEKRVYYSDKKVISGRLRKTLKITDKQLNLF